jgi:hypothetical protein
VRKKSKYKPKGVRLDVMTWVQAGLKPFTDISYGVNIRIKNHDAMDALRRGDATKADIDVLVGAFNMTEAYTMVNPEYGADWAEEIRAGQDALVAVARRGLQNHNRFILKAQELVAMNLVMEIHDAQLDKTTVRDMELAMEAIDKIFKAKKARPIVEQEKV